MLPILFNGGDGLKKEVISFRKLIAAGQTITLKERVKAQGTVEELRVRFYPGQGKDLRVIPVVLHKGDQAENMLTYAETSDKYLSGDDDSLIMPVVVMVDNDDQIQITATNVNATYTYTLVVDVVIDYFAGKNRVIGGVTSG